MITFHEKIQDVFVYRLLDANKINLLQMLVLLKTSCTTFRRNLRQRTCIIEPRLDNKNMKILSISHDNRLLYDLHIKINFISKSSLPSRYVTKAWSKFWRRIQKYNNIQDVSCKITKLIATWRRFKVYVVINKVCAMQTV